MRQSRTGASHEVSWWKAIVVWICSCEQRAVFPETSLVGHSSLVYVSAFMCGHHAASQGVRLNSATSHVFQRNQDIVGLKELCNLFSCNQTVKPAAIYVQRLRILHRSQCRGLSQHLGSIEGNFTSSSLPQPILTTMYAHTIEDLRTSC